MGCLRLPEALELFLEGRHLSLNGFDGEEHCQPADGRGRRGIREKRAVTGELENERSRRSGRQRRKGRGKGGESRGREARLRFGGLASSKGIAIWGSTKSPGPEGCGPPEGLAVWASQVLPDPRIHRTLVIFRLH